MRRAEALDVLALALREAGFEDSRLMARRLLADVLDVEPGALVLDPEAEIGAAAPRLAGALVRAIAGEPLTRIAGRRSFFGRDFRVTPDVLDPRPETELLVEEMLKRLAGLPAPHILDLGTGSGAILLSLLAGLPDATGVAVDLSAEALAVAEDNANRLGVASRVRWRQADLFAGLAGRFDAIVSNPPYIPAGELATLEPAVRQYDPWLALDGGADGLDFYRRIAWDVRVFLRPSGWLGLEVGAGQAEAVLALLDAAGLTALSVRHDLSGHARHVFGRG
ncbi:MAG: protein-(glutamine-N5) methyltransferase, release factor-specific [Methylobacterium sp.]|nr:MAG: protein-(glutamine-N5) methyltransferase, release factor-specific [Methylobacterium sp.]